MSANFLHNENQKISPGLNFVIWLPGLLINKIATLSHQAFEPTQTKKTYLRPSTISSTETVKLFLVCSVFQIGFVNPRIMSLTFGMNPQLVPSKISFHYRFESFIVEKREETLLYDAGSFLAAGRSLP